MTLRAFVPVALTVIALAATGCAFSDSDNRRALNLLDEHLTPESTGAKWALAPLTLPAGLVAGTIDAALVHPVTAIDDAWGDTTELLWSPDEDESKFRRAMFTPVAALATPAVFAGDWLFRSLFAIPPRADEGTEKEDR